MGRAKSEQMTGDTTQVAKAQKSWNANAGGLNAKLASIPKAMEDGKEIPRKDLRLVTDFNTDQQHLAASSPQYKKLSPAEKAKVDKMVVKMRNARRD